MHVDFAILLFLLQIVFTALDNLDPVHAERKSITLDFGKDFNITYEDHQPIYLCVVKKIASKVVLRQGLKPKARHSESNDKQEKDLLR